MPTRTAQVTVNANARGAVGPIGLQGPLGPEGPAGTVPGGVFSPESYGAVGDGVTNDTTAMQNLSTAVMAAGGGLIVLHPGATYLVGRQSLVNTGVWMWKGESVLSISGCPRPVILMGNGAKFKLVPNLKTGTFDAAGNSTTHALPYSGGDLSAPTPEGIVTFKTNSGKVILRDFEIDGNEANQNWGGPYGDTGWQIPGDCLFLNNNTGGEDVENVYAHHSVRDSCVLFGGGSPTTANSPVTGGTFKGCRFEYSCRQGLSFVGGRGYTFSSCKLNFAGKGSHSSAPGAGVDLEAESGLIRDLHFIDCELVGNSGNGLNADSGNIRRVKFTRCIFVGTSAWAVWVTKSYFTFDDCLMAGGIILNPTKILGDNGGAPNSALPRFTNCRITDDPIYSPTGALYAGAIINSGVNLQDTLFDRCSFRMCYNNTPSCSGGEFRDCSFDIGTLVGSLLNPKLTGRTTITAAGRVGFLNNTNGRVGGIYSGSINYNGVEVRSGSAVYDPPSLAAGARTTTTITVPWARLGLEDISVTFSLGLQGLKANAWVSTAAGAIADNGIQAVPGVVTVALENPTAGAIDLASGTLTVTVRDRDR